MLEGRKEAVGIHAVPALQTILQFLKLHVYEVAEAERLVATVTAALAAIDAKPPWRSIIRGVVSGSTEAVDDLSRLVLAGAQGIDTVQKPDGTWAASFFHLNLAHSGHGASEVEAALDALINGLSV